MRHITFLVLTLFLFSFLAGNNSLYADEMPCKVVLGNEGGGIKVEICKMPPDGQELIHLYVAEGWKVSYSLC